MSIYEMLNKVFFSFFEMLRSVFPDFDDAATVALRIFRPLVPYILWSNSVLSSHVDTLFVFTFYYFKSCILKKLNVSKSSIILHLKRSLQTIKTFAWCTFYDLVNHCLKAEKKLISLIFSFQEWLSGRVLGWQKQL